MEWKVRLVACCVLWLSQSLATSIPRRELVDLVLQVQRTSRIDEHSRPNELLVSESTEHEGNAWENSGKFEGDMILDRRQAQKIFRNAILGSLLRNGMRNLTSRWPNNEVNYRIKREFFSPQQIQAIERAMKYIERISCVRFRKDKKSNNGRLTISGKNAACFSTIGYKPKGSHINLSAKNDVGEGCFRHGTIVHEFLHVLGFFHMHSDPARDKYIQVHWENIIPKRREMFMKYRTEDATDFGVPYDFESIMHYSKTAFSANGKNSISPLKPTTGTIGQRESMTPRDIKRLNLMYCAKGSPSIKKMNRFNEL